ncbi:hypothetical protein MYX77_13180, partial [Acidobacteriia bacterium AH_259_A11_L15]|nr:hypothetical protein [Acidobacteriia bacterium AH_259_A11_L15]
MAAFLIAQPLLAVIGCGQASVASACPAHCPTPGEPLQTGSALAGPSHPGCCQLRPPESARLLAVAKAFESARFSLAPAAGVDSSLLATSLPERPASSPSPGSPGCAGRPAAPGWPR